jgi:hypothetical protein
MNQQKVIKKILLSQHKLKAQDHLLQVKKFHPRLHQQKLEKLLVLPKAVVAIFSSGSD